jgi:DNA modification methylase
LEPTLDLYIKHLVDIFDEIKRVLKQTGTCWVNLGDTYAGNHNRANDTRDKTGLGLRPGERYRGQRPGKASVAAKCLCLIPSRFSVEMCRRGWILRNRIIWWKPNSMPSSARDRFTVDFEEVFFFSKMGKYYFETQFEPYTEDLNRWGGDLLRAEGRSTWDEGTGQACYRKREVRPNPLGRRKRSVWRIPSKPFPEAHFAVYPPKLIESPIKAACPEFVCKKCGKPREKKFEGRSTEAFNIRVRDVQKDRIKHTDRKAAESEIRAYREETYGGSGKKCKGYSIPCSCSAGFEPGIVLDPFMGSGTTAVVALELNRNFIGVELNSDYVEIAERRIERFKQARQRMQTKPDLAPRDKVNRTSVNKRSRHQKSQTGRSQPTHPERSVSK